MANPGPQFVSQPLLSSDCCYGTHIQLQAYEYIGSNAVGGLVFVGSTGGVGFRRLFELERLEGRG